MTMQAAFGFVDPGPVGEKIYTKAAYRLEVRRIKEPEFVYNAHEPLSSPPAVAKFARPLETSDIEKMLVLYLNSKNKVIAIQVTTGTIDRQIIYPREVVKQALLSGSKSIIMIHNHPSGDPSPSPEDFHLTKTIQTACSVLDMAVLDHVIVGAEGRYYSFAESRNMPSGIAL